MNDMPDRDPEHWLYRLTADEWLRAADNELNQARQAFTGRQQRTGVTYARRAAGMALNALLWGAPDESYGRSYMDHLGAFSQDPAVREDLRAAAVSLLRMPLAQQLVTIGVKASQGDAQQAAPAALILEYVHSVIAPKGRA